ncbi:MAG: hypothetical protein NVSMB66_1120 [Candidatus Doudnabacteria bacterium]
MKKIFIILIFTFLFSNINLAKATDPGDAPDPVSGKCRNFYSNDGYLFDNYEKHDYIGGFLSVHFKMKNLYNDGRGWQDKFFLHKVDCSSNSLVPPQGLVEAVTPKMQFFSLRFNSESHYGIWDDEQDIPIKCAGCLGNIPKGDYTAVSYSGVRDGGATFFHSGSYPIKEVIGVKPNPLLFIPGILATELKLNDAVIWPNLLSMSVNPSNDFMDPLTLNPEGNSANGFVVTGEVLPKINYPLGAYHYSDLLISDLEKVGYKKNTNLFLMAYDWRLGASNLAEVLDKKIKMILAQTGAQKVNIVAHSMGGLILKEYVLKQGEENLDKVIFVGVPHLGTAEAARALLFGDNFDIPLLNAAEVHKLAQNMPSIYDLLPGKEYFKHTAGYYDDLTKTDSKGILNYPQSKDFLLGLNKNAKLIDKSENLHQGVFDNQVFKSDKIFNIIGCGIPTIKTINKMYYGANNLVKRIFNQPKYRITTDNGDGTALITSAGHLSVAAKQQFFVSKVNHNQLITADGTRSIIMALLSGQPLLNTYKHDRSDCAVKGRLLSLPSDLEIVIFDKKTDKKLAPDVNYSVKRLGNDTFIFLPNGADYKITALPLENTKKEFDISIQNYNNQKIKFYNNISLKKELVIQSPDNSPDLVQNVDEEGQSTVLPPQLETEGETADDQVPLTTLNYSGQKLSDGILKLSSEKKLSFEVKVGKSGLKSTQYSFDQGVSWQKYDAKEIDIPDSIESVYFFSISNNDYSEEPKNVFFQRLPQTNSQTNPPTYTPPNTSSYPPTPKLDPPVDPVVDLPEDKISEDLPIDPQPLEDPNLPTADENPKMLPANPTALTQAPQVFNISITVPENKNTPSTHLITYPPKQELPVQIIKAPYDPLSPLEKALKLFRFFCGLIFF